MTNHAWFPLGKTRDTTSNGFADQDNYTIRQWLGILGGNASTPTSLYGDITIEIAKAPSDVLIRHQQPALTSYASATNNETGFAITLHEQPDLKVLDI